MNYKKTVAAFVLILPAFFLTAEAKLYKWVDEKGVTHYGETIPPEYAGKDNVLFDDKGRVIKKNTQLTAEERRAANEAAIQKRQAELSATEQYRKDKMLLNTYSNEKEIDLARDRNLQQVEALFNSIQLLQKSAEVSAQDFQQEAKQFTAAGKPIPVSLKKDIADAEKKLIKLQQRQVKAQEKKDAILANFEADKLRYRKLTESMERR